MSFLIAEIIQHIRGNEGSSYPRWIVTVIIMVIIDEMIAGKKQIWEKDDSYWEDESFENFFLELFH